MEHADLPGKFMREHYDLVNLQSTEPRAEVRDHGRQLLARLGKVLGGIREQQASDRHAADGHQASRHSIEIAGARVFLGPLVRIEIPLEPDDPMIEDPLGWLSLQTCPVRVFWSNRDRTLRVAGIGAADIVTGAEPINVRELFERLSGVLERSAHDLKYFGGICFNGSSVHDPSWRTFGTYRFLIPRFEVVNRPYESYFACNFQHGKLEEAVENVDELVIDGAELPFQFPVVVGDRTDTPNRDDWTRLVAGALDKMSGPEKSNRLEKVVLARKTEIMLAHPVDAAALLRRMGDLSSHVFVYCLQTGQSTAFIGCTPERLFSLSKSVLESEAIAGTRPRGTTAEDDGVLRQRLLSSEKDLREHRYVHDSIYRSLQELCSPVEVSSEVHVMALPSVQHLLTRFSGVLRRTAGVGDIVAALHPTPAVGGFPTNRAVTVLEQLEPFDRGWYAAPIGWVGRDEAEFAIGIRSALVDDRSLRLYTGAGIVSGSDADLEWEELEQKMRPFVSLL